MTGTWTPAERARLLGEYLASGETQEEFCRGLGRPSPRSLRSWRAAARKPADAIEAARHILQKAVQQLQRVLDAFDVVGEVGTGNGQNEARHALEPAAASYREASDDPAREVAREKAAFSQKDGDGGEKAMPEADAAVVPEAITDCVEIVEEAASSCRLAESVFNVEAAWQERPRRRGLVEDWT